MRKSKSFFVIILGITMVVLFANKSIGQGKKGATFNLITYNIRMNTPDDGVNAWPLRKDKVAGLPCTLR